MKKIAALLLAASCLLANLTANAPKKLVVLDPSVVEIVYMLGAQDQLAAIATLQFSKIWPEDQTVKLKSVGTYTKPNIEQIVELKPDLVITSFHSANVNESLAKFNLKTLTLKDRQNNSQIEKSERSRKRDKIQNRLFCKQRGKGQKDTSGIFLDAAYGL